MKSFIWLIAALFLVPSCAGVGAKKDIAASNTRPIVTFVFDDGNGTDYTVAKDIFKAQGAVACTAVVSNRVNTENHLSVSQLKELQDAGWEILSHTKSHPNLKTLTEEQIEAELSGSKSVLEALGFSVKNLVYPYNKNNDIVRKVAEKYYRSARGGRSMLNSIPLEMYELKSYSLKHDISKMKDYIDNAYSEKKWLIFYHHQIDAKIRITGKNGNFMPGEDLVFKPSGATGKYTAKGICPFGSAMYITPLSGAPQVNDIVTGQKSDVSGVLDKVYYNERENITDLIKYIHTKYPDMEIVTIDKGLDIIRNSD